MTMKRWFTLPLALSLLLLFSVAPGRAADLEFGDLIQQVSLQAKVDLPGFKGSLTTEFGVPLPKIDLLLKTLPTPGDAFFCLRLARLSGQSPESVMRRYQANQGQGWGTLAKSLGIKPGSKEFHALKQGRSGSGKEQGGREEQDRGDHGKGKKHSK